MKPALPSGAILIALANGAAAADAAPAPTTTLLQVVLGLGVVLAAIAAAAWLARRYLPAAGSSGGPLRVVGGVMVGPRERIVVVEVAGTWIVAGVTPQNVNALHALPRPAGGDGALPQLQPADHNFSRWLAKAIKGR